MLCSNCNVVMRAGPVIDNWSQIEYCPNCGRLAIVTISEVEDDETQFVSHGIKDETEESHREQNH